MSTVTYELKGRVCVLTLNRPEARNAINRQLRADLRAALERFDDDPSARVGILTGAGKSFSAGRDLKERASDNAAGIVARPDDSMSANSLHSWRQPRKPLIAAINGHCLAGGFSIAQMCDLRIAAEDASLGITEPRMGLLAPFASLLPKLIPTATVMELVLTGQPMTARRAYEIGFVNRVVPNESLLSEAIALGERIADNAPLSVEYSKELVYRSLELDDGGLLRLTHHMYARLLESEDAKEGPRAFVEKRPPEWKGR
ncbi:enoyl-CoA hydratase/isomerase family protein [Tenggerimyces flavus]|uniref:Enoyl-CoA hydratase/isomerase family protein n=1 Tax=Tenggerimyces flavus TaxID=1708749 RepID=A0ABV7Y9U3_9ACTN|nr:enoyl-CoA hydratase-related protein [Tenggerimyces flavus]MBM7789782.1 enoyl-CoA hydratase/carnithine racemase [Tenggerimyces flavus]